MYGLHTMESIVNCRRCSPTSAIVKKCGVHTTVDCPLDKKPCVICSDEGHSLKTCSVWTSKCYACGKFGHLSFTCPNLTNEKTRLCYICSSPDHIATNCVSHESKDDRKTCRICLTEPGVQSKKCTNSVCKKKLVCKRCQQRCPVCPFCRMSTSTTV